MGWLTGLEHVCTPPVSAGERITISLAAMRAAENQWY